MLLDQRNARSIEIREILGDQWPRYCLCSKRLFRNLITYEGHSNGPSAHRKDQMLVLAVVNMCKKIHIN